MQVNIAILVVCCSLRAGNTIAFDPKRNSGTVNPGTPFPAATQITVLFFALYVGLFLDLRCIAWVYNVVGVDAGHIRALEM